MKIDLKKELKELYTKTKKKPWISDVEKTKYISIEGKGNPNNSEEFSTKTEALYTVAYTIKFYYKEKDKDFVVMPLEGLWYCDDNENFRKIPKEEWQWRIMILIPDFVTDEDIKTCQKKAYEKKKNEEIKNIIIEKFDDKKVASILHTGSYSKEESTIDQLHNYIKENGYKINGLHREIYMSDPRRVEESKLKTIIRYPITKI